MESYNQYPLARDFASGHISVDLRLYSVSYHLNGIKITTRRDESVGTSHPESELVMAELIYENNNDGTTESITPANCRHYGFSFIDGKYQFNHPVYGTIIINGDCPESLTVINPGMPTQRWYPRDANVIIIDATANHPELEVVPL